MFSLGHCYLIVMKCHYAVFKANTLPALARDIERTSFAINVNDMHNDVNDRRWPVALI